MTNIEQHHDMVKKSLSQFIKKNIPGANLKIVDDIVLEYVISILEEASEDESFDVEAFQEMMSAYFSDFADIDQGVICTWIFELESQLSKQNAPKENGKPILSFESFSLTDMIPEEKLRGRQPNNPLPLSECPESNGHVKRKQNLSLSETSDGSGSTDSTGDLFLEEYDRLQEIFPESTSMEIKYCLSIANGDVDSARQIIIHRQESGQSFHNTSRNAHKHSNKKVDEKELKNRIIERYSYIDQNDTSREHRPVIPKVEPKKMIRYRDNKIVSLRGEKFTESRDDDHEPRKPKKVLP